MHTGRTRVVLLATVLAVGLSGCDQWRQVGFGPEGQRSNVSEARITPDNVATLPPRVLSANQSGMAYADGLVYVSGAGTVEAYTAAGCGNSGCNPVWRGTTVTSPFPSFAIVAVGGDVLYVHESTARGGAAGETVAFDTDGCGASTCTPLWRSGNLTSVASAMAVAEGHLFLTGRTFAPGDGG